MAENDHEALFGFRIVIPPRSTARHEHVFHEFCFSFADAGTQLLRDGSAPLRKGDLYFLPAGYPHIAGGDERGHADLGVLNFSGGIFNISSPGETDAARAVEMLGRRAWEGRPLVRLTPAGKDSVRKAFLRMTSARGRRAAGADLAVRITAQEIILASLRDGCLSNDERPLFSRLSAGDGVKRAQRFIELNFRGAVSASRLAGAAGMSRGYLHAVFRRETGKTVTEYINELRCNEAVRLLGGADLSPREICARCGFGSLSNFHRAFLAHTGRRPGDFRGKS
jgi:AraC-like DNA-binding protein